MKHPTDAEVFALIRDYQRDLGPTLPFKDARRLLVLYDQICALFEKHLTPEERGERNLITDYRNPRG